jgi:short-subunit dehydrogenase
LFGGKVVIIPGFQNKLMIQSLRIAPRAMVRRITRGLQQTKQ